jgi:hypothetical protein
MLQKWEEAPKREQRGKKNIYIKPRLVIIAKALDNFHKN